MTQLSDRVGEVIEASTTIFIAQCYELYQSPPLGSLVKTGDASGELYGVVCQATTAGLEPGRRPIARGKDESSEAAIYSSNPQLQKLLRSEFSALVIGHKDNGAVRHFLPPQPAHIHAFVHRCSPAEVKEFSQSLNFLDLLLNSRLSVPSEELVAACLRQISQTREDPSAFLLAAGRELSLLLSGELNRLKAILGKVRQ